MLDQRLRESQCQVPALSLDLTQGQKLLSLLKALRFYQRQEGGEMIISATSGTFIRKTEAFPEISLETPPFWCMSPAESLVANEAAATASAWRELPVGKVSRFD